LEQQLKQFNVQLPAWMIAAVHKRVSEILAQTAEKIPTGEIVGQALVFWLGPFETSNIKDAVFKAKIEAARPMLQKEIEGKSVEITLTSKDVADLIRQLRKAVEMDASIIDEGLTQ
jgi:hypothetical protein